MGVFTPYGRRIGDDSTWEALLGLIAAKNMARTKRQLAARRKQISWRAGYVRKQRSYRKRRALVAKQKWRKSYYRASNRFRKTIMRKYSRPMSGRSRRMGGVLRAAKGIGDVVHELPFSWVQNKTTDFAPSLLTITQWIPTPSNNEAFVSLWDTYYLHKCVGVEVFLYDFKIHKTVETQATAGNASAFQIANVIVETQSKYPFLFYRDGWDNTIGTWTDAVVDDAFQRRFVGGGRYFKSSHKMNINSWSEGDYSKFYSAYSTTIVTYMLDHDDIYSKERHTGATNDGLNPLRILLVPEKPFTENSYITAATDPSGIIECKINGQCLVKVRSFWEFKSPVVGGFPSRMKCSTVMGNNVSMNTV